ncbi:MAG: helix-turn-helix transcriptional regulator [Clostridia bacterium]|nr:helix-turn-helix transcriptional regulator [Clostridia bacterium]
MEFNEKLQELRRQKGLTQDELAEALYVSRTAVSKWESGRGYPNIDSLKLISKYFSVSLDNLLSSDEILCIAEEDSKKKAGVFRDTVFACLDLCTVSLLFLPFFACKWESAISAVSLLSIKGVSSYIIIAYYAYVLGSGLFGIVTFALQSCSSEIWTQNKYLVSILINVVGILLLTVGLQPYAAVFSFILLAVKVLFLLKRS